MDERNRSTVCAYLDALAVLLKKRRDVVVLESAKESDSSGIGAIMSPLAEQDLVLAASGLALEGKTVFINAPASPTLAGRAYEEIRATVAIPNLRVVISTFLDGTPLSQEGASRQMAEDIALMRAIPNMAVLTPSDYGCAYALTFALAENDGPAYIRLSYAECADLQTHDAMEEKKFSPGGARLLREGDGVTVCACGIMVHEALKAATILSQQGIRAEVIDCYSVKPFPEQALLSSVRRTGACVVAEKHSRIGGAASAAAECLARSYPVPLRTVAIDDDFGQSGSPDELMEFYGLTHREIVHNAVQVWALRRR